MDDESCQGFTNWDTWNLAVWVENSERPYNIMRSNKEKLLRMDDEELLDFVVITTGNPDHVDLSKINMDELRDVIRDLS